MRLINLPKNSVDDDMDKCSVCTAVGPMRKELSRKGVDNLVILDTTWWRSHGADTYQERARACNRALRGCNHLLHKRAGNVRQRLRAQPE